MILHSLSLAVESIVLGTLESRFPSACETALEGCADCRGAQLRGKALGASEHRSLREHCVVVLQLLFGSQVCCCFEVVRFSVAGKLY